MKYLISLFLVVASPLNMHFFLIFFKKDNKKNGHGRYEGANGVYEGNYMDGKKSGVRSWP